MPGYLSDNLTKAHMALGAWPGLAVAARALAKDSTAINAELHNEILANVPAFSDSHNPDILPDLERHCGAHTGEILRLLEGGPVGAFDFVGEHGRRCADQRFPLEATLHAYRCCHKVFARRVRDATVAAMVESDGLQKLVAAAADFTMEYANTVSTIATDTYVSHARFQSNLADDLKVNLLNVLLEGYDESDGRVTKILRDAGYLDRRQAFCVALAQPVDPAEMQNPSRAARLADSIEKSLRGTAFRSLIDIRDNTVTAVCSDMRRTSGWTAPRMDLARRLSSAFLTIGPAAVVGVSNDAPSTARIPTAFREAQLALQLADVSHRVMQFAEIPMQRLLFHLAGEEFQRVLPSWAAAYFQADAKARGALGATLRAYADADMNVLQTAKALKIHPNTIYSRLQRILDVTGLDARSYHALTELLVISECGQNRPTG